MKTYSIMSKSTFLQYFFSISTISLCLIIPWTVIWTPKFSQANKLVTSVNTESLHVTNSLSSINFLQIKTVEHAIDYRLATLINHQSDKLFKKVTTSIHRPSTKLQLDYSISCKTTITPQLGFHLFELNLLLFNLSILSCCSFIQLYFYSKLSMMLVGILIFMIGFNTQEIYECLGQSIHSVQPLLKFELTIQMIFYVIFLHIIDRRVN